MQRPWQPREAPPLLRRSGSRGRRLQSRSPRRRPSSPRRDQPQHSQRGAGSSRAPWVDPTPLLNGSGRGSRRSSWRSSPVRHADSVQQRTTSSPLSRTRLLTGESPTVILLAKLHCTALGCTAQSLEATEQSCS